MYECEGKRYELIKADSTNSCKDCVFMVVLDQNKHLHV